MDDFLVEICIDKLEVVRVGLYLTPYAVYGIRTELKYIIERSDSPNET
jgi:hypothetical protein